MIKTLSSKKAYIFSFLVFSLSVVIFRNRIFNISWFIGGFIFIYLFFYQVNAKTLVWDKFVPLSFQKRLFLYAFLFRLLALLIISIIAEINTGEPFYVGAMDAKAYYGSSTYALDLWLDDGIQRAFGLIARPGRAPDDYGMFFFLMFLHLFTFKSIYLTKIILCLISSYTVVQGYKLTRLLWDERTARLAGLMLMVFPLSLFYGVIYLKANIITFLIINLSYLVTNSYIKNQFKFKTLFFIIIQIGMLFFLRTATGALMVLLIAGAFFMNYFKGSRILSISLGLIIIGLFIIFLSQLGLTDIYYNRISAEAESFGESYFQNVTDVNALAKIGSLPLFFAISIFAPFPTLIIYHGVSHGPFNYYIPGLMIWNMLALFAVFGLIKSMKKEYRKLNVMLWGFSLGYLYLLVNTTLFTSTRFSYSSMPTLLILAAVGIRHTKAMKYWNVYLIAIGVLIIAWNYFKLAGRGLI